MDDGFAVIASQGEPVLEATDDVGHFGKLLEVFQLSEQVYSLLHDEEVVGREGHLHDGVVGAGVAVVFLVVHLDGRVVAEFVGTHHLEVSLHGAQGDALSDTFAVVEGFGAGIDEVVERPSAKGVAQTVVNGLVANECVFVSRHGVLFFF